VGELDLRKNKNHCLLLILVVLDCFLCLRVTAQKIEFVQRTGVENPLDGAEVTSGLTSHSIDIDDDGDFDLFMGNSNGTIFYYENIGTIEEPNLFDQQIGVGNPLYGIDVGTKSAPTFVDIDKDGDFDVFIGATNSISYYKNIGTKTAAVYELQLLDNNPLKSITSSGDRAFTVTFLDIDSDTDLDAFIGWVDYDVVNSQGIVFCENIGNLSVPVFENKLGPENPFEQFDKLYPKPIFIDIDADDDFDVFIGKGDGDYLFYENISDTALDVKKDINIGFEMYPNPVKDILTISLLGKDIHVKIYDLLGMQVLSKDLTDNNETIDVRRLTAGIYVAVIDDGKNRISKKIIVSK